MTPGEAERLAHACRYAVKAHAGQARKGTAVPYVAHVLAVAALVLEHGGTAEQAIAGALHDVVEDQGGHDRAADVRTTFGPEVADLVLALSDAAPAAGEVKGPWLDRKVAHLDDLARLIAGASPAVLVAACDRLHNLRTIGEDLDDPAVGTAVFARFRAPSPAALGWVQARQVAQLVAAPDALVPPRLKDHLRRALARIEAGLAVARDEAAARGERWDDPDELVAALGRDGAFGGEVAR
jgi:hypothetical protein